MLENKVIQSQQFHKSPATDASREKSRQVSKSIRSTLAQAVELKDLAFKTALEIAAATDPKQLAQAREKARAVYDATKAWEISVDRVRVVRNKPLPGSRRPAPEQPKQKKQTAHTFSESKPE
jgi:hypothetical protein